MMRFALLFCFLFGMFLSPAHAGNGAVTDLRLFYEGDTTRLTLEIDRAVPYRTFVLNNPMRMVIDLPLVDWRAPMNKGDRRGRIKSYRQSVFQGDTRRVVFDLNIPMQVVRHTRLAPSSGKGWQYIFDMRVATAVQFQQALNKVQVGGGASNTATVGTSDNHTVNQGTIPAMETSPVLTASTATKIPLIVIDAGHGGVDSGAIASNGVYEKNITLATARKLRDVLLATKRYRVKMTRDSDVFIKLPQRVAIARQAGADLFVSLHADTIMRPTVQGASVYTLSETASDAETAKLAERENAVDSLVNVDVGDVEDDVADILIDLVTRDTMNQSKVLAGTVVSTFKISGVAMLPQNPHRSAGFAVLKAPDIPSVLIEMGYLSNRNEADKLSTAAHQQKIASAIAKVVDRFFERAE
jgi:N-acetylmuramoyl-L-alanine amidase